jgi:hypothetical protein
MQYPSTSTLWLSDDMAHALAAMCPPLETEDVLQAALSLSNANADGRTVGVIDRLLRLGPDLLTVRRVVEALCALRDARVTDSSLAAWVLLRESDGASGPPGAFGATERVCQKLVPRLSELVSSVGAQALLARSLHVARSEYPFLEGVRAGDVSEPYLVRLREHSDDDIDSREVGAGLQAVVGILLSLLVGFIGEDLILTIVRDVWPDLPASEPGRPQFRIG